MTSPSDVEVIEETGKFVLQSGVESGPTLMRWNDHFPLDKKIVKWLTGISWCDNRMDTTLIWKFEDKNVGMVDYIKKIYPHNIETETDTFIKLKEPFFFPSGVYSLLETLDDGKVVKMKVRFEILR